jgi:Lrp/AsnC family leucine-responsive transcriptional regulator
MLDEVDDKALRRLTEEGRVTWAELAQDLKLSAPAAADRVRRLEERGVIRGYTALVDAEAAGYPLLAFIAVTLGSIRGNLKERDEFLAMIQGIEEVQECHHLASSDDFLLKVRCRSTLDLERILIERLRSLPIVTGTRTSVVLGTTKECPSLTSAKTAPAKSRRKAWFSATK